MAPRARACAWAAATHVAHDHRALQVGRKVGEAAYGAALGALLTEAVPVNASGARAGETSRRGGAGGGGTYLQNRWPH